MKKSPFKFLDSYSKEDRDIFFGRDKEVEELYSGVFKSKILVVYGTSGTGKSSLIDCGLANKFSDLDWLPVSIRRGSDINLSLTDSLNKSNLTRSDVGNGINDILKVIQSLYLDNFRPIYLIFDQFEELFIFGSREEKEELAQNIKKIIESDLQCRLIFSIREEYLASLTEFEKIIPSFLSNRTRIEKMTRQNAISVIEGPCKLNGILVEPGFPELLLEKLNPDTSDIELTWLQVYLDKLFRMASDKGEDVRILTRGLLEKAGEVKDLLGTFLEEQVAQLDDPETGLVVLKSFVSVKGTRQQINEEEVIDNTRTLGKNIDSEAIKEIIQKFVRLRILRDKDENGRYELRHDTLAAKIYEMITMVEKELLEIRQFLDHSYNSFERRGILLSAQDLRYIAPYEDKLFLSEKISKFISLSKRATQRARRRRQRILVSTALTIIAVLSFFTVWAMRERDYARLQEADAKTQKEKADSAAAVADSSRIVAEVSRIAAIDSGKKAVEQRDYAYFQRRLAERNEAEAKRQSEIAAKQTDSANNASRRAERNAIRAEQERVEALRLRMLSIGKALSVKSLQLQDQKELQTLLAYQAYLFNATNGGNPGDADIYQGLYSVEKQYGSSGYKVFSGHSGEIKSIAFIPGKNEFFSSGFDGKLIRWTMDGRDPASQVVYPGPEIFEVVTVSTDGSLVACGGRNSVITVMSVNNNEILYDLKGHLKQINSLVFSDDGRYLWSASLDGRIIKWDLQAKSPVDFNTGGILVNSLDVSSDNAWLTGISSDGKVEIWNIENPLDKLSIYPPGKIVKTIKFKPGGNTIALGCSDGYVEFWDVTTKSKISGINAHAAGVNAIRFNTSLNQVATAGNDRIIRIWDEKDLTAPPITIDDNEGYVMAIEFSQDGKMIISGSYEGAVNLTGRATGADIMAKEVSGLITRKLTAGEWSIYIGRDIEYENLY